MTTRSVDEICADFHAGRADADPYDEIKALIAEVERLQAAVELREQRHLTASDRADAAIAEVRSLRGVVQAVRQIAESWPDGDERASEYAAARGQCKRAILAALAAAADAPQPAPELRCERPGGCVCDPFRRSPDCRWSAGPSPAVLPEKEHHR